jgi:gamma-glutamyltranspeptidase/glutathione hydrolase
MRCLLRVAGCLAALVTTTVPTFAQQQVAAERYVVVSGHPAATAAGLEVLRHGGNVVDAAVATSLALGVALPYGSGLGGKMVMLHRDGASGRVRCIEATCAAPAALDYDAYRKLPLAERRFGYTAAGVPALPAGLWRAHQEWGQLAWADLVAPAITLAEEGVEFTEAMRRLCEPDMWSMRDDAEAARLYLAEGEALPAGSVLQNPDLASTLRRLAERGMQGFYEGETAERIVAAANANGSPMSVDDLRNYRAYIVEPLSTEFRGATIYTSPPPQLGGLTVLMALKALESRTWEDVEPADAGYIDAVSRVLLSVYPRVDRYVADVPGAKRVARRLLSAESIAQVLSDAQIVDPANPRDHEQRIFETADDLIDASTVHLTIADSQGNIVSLTQSLSFHFGAGVVVPGTGILLNNSLANFSVAPDSVNRVAGGKRPRSTVAPLIVTRDDEPVMALGIPGGQRIPTTSIQLLMDVFSFDMSLAEAFAEPRFHVRRPTELVQDANIVDLEGTRPRDTRNTLTTAGWQVLRWQPDGRYFGGGNAVAYQPDGTLLGIGDARRDNRAVGE